MNEVFVNKRIVKNGSGSFDLSNNGSAIYEVEMGQGKSELWGNIKSPVWDMLSLRCPNGPTFLGGLVHVRGI